MYSGCPGPEGYADFRWRSRVVQEECHVRLLQKCRPRVSGAGLHRARGPRGAQLGEPASSTHHQKQAERSKFGLGGLGALLPIFSCLILF